MKTDVRCGTDTAFVSCHLFVVLCQSRLHGRCIQGIASCLFSEHGADAASDPLESGQSIFGRAVVASCLWGKVLEHEAILAPVGAAVVATAPALNVQ
ncbi:MAG: hypothetical protein ACOYBW_08760 [Fluviibacter phosphoraccumulans]